MKVLPNVTHIYQPLDVSVNSASKQFMKRKFVDWYARQIVTEMNKDTDVEQIRLQMKLSVMQPLHASWLFNLYNYMTSSPGGIHEKMKKSGIYNAVVINC